MRFGDIPALLAAIDRVIAWDDGHADDYASMKSRDEVNADEIRRTRSEKGLPNRGP